MGRKSRHKLERRLGLAQPSPKEAERTRVKAERRARNVPPTVEAYERVAASGPARLTATLISRHSTRIENLGAVAQLSMDHCVRHLLSVCELDALFVRGGHQLTQLEPPHESPWPTHLSWGLQSTIAAVRLMLAGQIVGAAVLLRQQLGRWTLLLARAGIARERCESIESFIARAWSRRALEMFGLYVGDVTTADMFDDLDEHARTTGVVGTNHQHVRIDDRVICPANVYHTLCMLIDAHHTDQPAERDPIHDLDEEHSQSDAHDATDVLSDALALCIFQMQLSVARMCQLSGDFDTAPAIGDTSARERQLAQYTSEAQLPLRKPLVPRLTPALAPLVDAEVSSFTNIDYLWRLYTDYHAVLSGRCHPPLGTPRELAELAFAAHRFSRRLVTEAAHAQDLQLSEGRLKIHQHHTHVSPQILTAEFAALCASWNQSQPEIAAAAAQIASTLLSGYWLWLEDDDRGMGILRCTLHQAARLRTWRTNVDAARALDAISWTTPRRWRNVAGLSQYRALDRALFEFAHANRESRLDAAAILLSDDDDDPESLLSQRVARQTALDEVTALAAIETIKVVATHQSVAIANTMRQALQDCGLSVRINRTRRQPNR